LNQESLVDYYPGDTINDILTNHIHFHLPTTLSTAYRWHE